jgi:hypothetical protein
MSAKPTTPESKITEPAQAGGCRRLSFCSADGTVRDRPVKLLRRKPGGWAEVQFLDTGGLSFCEWWEFKPNFGAHTRREQPLNTTMPNDKQTTSESPPCDAASSPECDQCHHWEFDDGRHGFMSGYCPIFQKVTHREHGTQCTAWTRIHLENSDSTTRVAS